jgi:hypothetical protein
MEPALRAAFNANYRDGVAREVQSRLEARLECKFEFRLAETPVFLPDDLREKLVGAAHGILAQLSDPKKIAAMERDLPARYATPRRGALPGVAILDFAVTRGAGGALEPKLVELQGFPSLFGLTFVHADTWGPICSEMPGMPKRWTSLFSGLTADGYRDLLRRSILGRHAPQEVVLADLDPTHQKTSPDFWATRELVGIDAVCPTTFERDGRRLFRRVGGKLVSIRRIYHRVVFDELERRGSKLPYRYDEDLEVEWFPHPAWYFLWSKSSLPHLDHPAVPRTRRLSELAAIPEDLPNYVLKPFHSFAGGGVNVDPKEADVARVPTAERHHWCLQEKVEYAPAIAAADGGGVKVEVRMMFLRPDEDAQLTLATNLCRLSRGKMLGVDFNKDFTWVGGSVGIWPDGPVAARAAAGAL